MHVPMKMAEVEQEEAEVRAHPGDVDGEGVGEESSTSMVKGYFHSGL